MYHRVGEKRTFEDICIEDEACVESLGSCRDRSLSPKEAMENEKRIRREIANSNERRRMQSINAGFTSLKSLLPKQEGEKLSKAAILQHTSEYVYKLEQEKTRLLTQNCQLKRLLNNQQKEFDGSQSGSDSPREDRSTIVEIMDTLVSSGSVSPDQTLEEMQRELADCRSLLEHERSQRLKYEEYVKVLEGQIFNEKESSKKEVKQPGQSFVVTKNKDFNIDCVTPKPGPLMTPLLPTITSLHSSSLAPQDKVEIKEEDDMEIDALNNISCHTAQQPITMYANCLSTNRLDTHQESTIIPPTGTIVTVLSSNSTSNMASVLEVQGDAEIETSTSVREPIMDDNQTVYIMKTSNSAQKSLDTICEAIRHLEGEHMFPMEDQQSRLEEEVVTEDTYTVEDEYQHQSVPQDLHESPTEMVKFSNNMVSPHPLYSSHTPSSHPIGGSMSNLTLHMMPSEPQEVPLELTTTHRGTKYPCVNASRTVLSHSATRPGVIVVKHT